MAHYEINHVKLENIFLHQYTANLSLTKFSPVDTGAKKMLITCTVIVDMEDLSICRETFWWYDNKLHNFTESNGTFMMTYTIPEMCNWVMSPLQCPTKGYSRYNMKIVPN